MIETPWANRPPAESDLDSLAGALGVSAASFGHLLLAYCARGQVPMSVKQIATGRYVWVNAPMAAVFGCSVDQLIGSADAEVSLGPAAAALRSAEQAAAAQRGVVVSEHRLDVAGRRRDYSVLRMPLAEQDTGAPARYLVALWTDLTEARGREAQLKLALAQLEDQQNVAEQLRRDAQDAWLRGAGAYGSPHFDDLLRREIDLSSREHREFALVLVALDPASGASADPPEARARVLEALGQQLRSKTRAMDASCRLDEDRFAVLLSGVGLATAHARMEGLRRQCASHIVVLDGRDFGFTVSMGVASFPHTADTQEGLIEASVAALTEAVRRGGNHVALASIPFDPR